MVSNENNLRVLVCNAVYSFAYVLDESILALSVFDIALLLALRNFIFRKG